MSAHNDEMIICPNCGHHTTLNYCAQCGQETHLHKETFWALILHFIGHYFHYDSKFWKTMKTLITKPGELTVAYWKKQRARYIPPVSLYIFISSLFFLFYILSFSNRLEKGRELMKTMNSGTDSVHVVKDKLPSWLSTNDGKEIIDNKAKFEEVAKPLEESMHQMPKVCFFLVPLVALMLKLLLYKRKDLFFVDHAVFSIHLHSAAFLILLVYDILASLQASLILSFALYFGIVAYTTAALSHAYKMNTGRAIGYTLLLAAIYLIVWIAILMTILMYYSKRHTII
jgi:hypothetical protein